MAKRTAEDAKTDPQPGDIVQFRKTVRTVTLRQPNYVQYSTPHRHFNEIELAAWQKQSPKATVIFVAGGKL